ncbi:transposase [Vibrio cholerae]|uniref:Transposase n=1 Tax=Vibrio cholerae TaxID=666 RepID=A0A655X8C1_VIBCL|nr:transposase [Vibrio cholerae]
MKRVLSMPLGAQQGFIDSVFKLASIPLYCPHYIYISRLTRKVDISFKTKTRGVIQHLDVDFTSLKVYGQG